MKIILLLAIAGVSCGLPHASNSSLNHLSVDPNAKNIALLIGSSQLEHLKSRKAPAFLGGVIMDIPKMKTLLQDKALGFEVVVLQEPTYEDLMKETAKAAAEVGKNGTLFWYYSGHADDKGGLIPKVEDALETTKTFGIKEFFASLVAWRLIHQVQTPMKRLIFIVDACFSGQWTEGSKGLKALTKNIELFEQPNLLFTPFKEYFGITSSRWDQTAKDDGLGVGSRFTNVFLKSMAAQRDKIQKHGAAPRFQDLLDDMNAKLKEFRGQQMTSEIWPENSSLHEETIF